MPEFDEDGNQLYIQTETGDWALNYNAANRPTDFSCMDEEGNFLTVKCDYDSMGRRVFKKVISGTGTVTSHHPPPQTLSAIARRACYACLPSQSGNAAEAGCDLTRTNHPALWLITWDPTEPVATRPLTTVRAMHGILRILIIRLLLMLVAFKRHNIIESVMLQSPIFLNPHERYNFSNVIRLLRK